MSRIPQHQMHLELLVVFQECLPKPAPGIIFPGRKSARTASQVPAAGFTAQDGQIVDASIVRVPVQRNTREENAQIKAGTPPLDSWNAPKRSQKDVDARWTKKYSTHFYGYKNHIQVDVKHKFIRSSICTPANVHDGDVLEDLLDSTNTGRFVYADSAYDSKANRDMLQRHGLVARIVKRACRYRHLDESEQLLNRSFSRIRCP